MKTVSRVGVLSVGKVYALLMVIFGLIIGVIYGIGGCAVGAIMDGGWLGGLGFLAIIIFPIIYGITGFISGVIGAALYNVVAKWVGGIELEIN